MAGTTFRLALGPINLPVQWIPGVLCPGVRRSESEGDHYLHFMPSLIMSLVGIVTRWACRPMDWSCVPGRCKKYLSLVLRPSGPAVLRVPVPVALRRQESGPRREAPSDANGKNVWRCTSSLSCVFLKIKGKVHPRTGHEGPEESRGIALLFL